MRSVNNCLRPPPDAGGGGVIGSSAHDCLCRPYWGVASIVLADLIALICSDNSETLGLGSLPGS